MTLPVRGSRSDRAELARWDPFDELERFDQMVARLLDPRWRWPSSWAEVFTPLADVEETDDAYVVELELPGVTRDQVQIEVSGRRLRVHGERTERVRTGVLRRRERTIGRFSFEVVLPGDLDSDAVEAHLEHGVLTVRLPKPEVDRPRRIPIS